MFLCMSVSRYMEMFKSTADLIVKSIRIMHLSFVAVKKFPTLYFTQFVWVSQVTGKTNFLGGLYGACTGSQESLILSLCNFFDLFKKGLHLAHLLEFIQKHFHKITKLRCVYRSKLRLTVPINARQLGWFAVQCTTKHLPWTGRFRTSWSTNHPYFLLHVRLFLGLLQLRST